jgi:hypothetical protein
VSREPSASDLLESFLTGYPRVENWSYWLPTTRLLRIIPWTLMYGGFAVILALPLLGIGGLPAGVLGVVVSLVGCYLGHWSDAFNPIVQIAIVEDAIFVKRITRHDVVRRDHVKSMKFTPARDDDYDEMQRGRRFYEARIAASGRRVRVDCWLLVTESEAYRLREWLVGSQKPLNASKANGEIVIDAATTD